MTTPIKQKLDELITKKLVRVKSYADKGLGVYKYNNKVFFDNLWHKSPYLLKARGLVLDNAGNIVQHPFDKIFNFNENGAGKSILPTQKVIAVEKENGFLACITRDPLDENKLLCSTTGSLDSDFVTYIQDLISPELEKAFLKYFKNNNVTLMFEAVHPEDPHIIKYEKEDEGLWLIGARGKNENDKVLKEEELDTIAATLKLKRPSYFVEEFGQVVKRIASEKIEGYVIRDIATQEPILKLKTNYYLTTKFIGRMGKNNIDLMYKNPTLFKEKIEEEFYELVDVIISRKDKAALLEMTNESKIEMLRGIIEELNSQRNAAPVSATPSPTIKP